MRDDSPLPLIQHFFMPFLQTCTSSHITYVAYPFSALDIEKQRSEGTKVFTETLTTFVKVMTCKFTSHQIFWLLLQILEIE